MTPGSFAIGESISSEGGAIIQIFRLLSDEEQRIAYAILEGMRLQKDLDSQKQSNVKVGEGRYGK